MIDRDLAIRLGEVFAGDLAGSVRITYEEWKRRPYLERILAMFGVVFARQSLTLTRRRGGRESAVYIGVR